MKKLLIIVTVACLFTACNNESGSAKEKETVTKEVPVSTDTAARMTEPQSNTIMELPDTPGRRPHQ